MSARPKSQPAVPRAPGLFNACELVVCGFSGTGKTTLLERVLPYLSTDLSVAYVKHDAHRFEMDRAGKDSARMREAGASGIWINDGDHHAQVSSGSLEKLEQRMLFADADAVLIEGWKASSAPKLVMLDASCSILDELKHPESVVAVCGPSPRPSTLPDDMIWFDRDDVEAVATWIRGRWDAERDATSLCGLILTGGRSSRMKQDKAALSYSGRDQTHACYDLLSGVVDEAFVSCRLEQASDPDKVGLPQLHDRLDGLGPMGGILTALMSRPNTAWVVIACDLPFVNRQTLERLLSARNGYRHATAFLSAHDGMPEPLCAVYEPKSLFRLMQFVGLGYSCPRKVLLNSRCEFVDQDDPSWLDNVNTPEEFEAAQERLAIGGD